MCVYLIAILPLQITYMENDMDKGNPSILCTKVDEHAGDWPSASFVGLFDIAKLCVETKLHTRPEISAVCCVCVGVGVGGCRCVCVCEYECMCVGVVWVHVCVCVCVSMGACVWVWVGG